MQVHWDRINIQYPVRKYPTTGESSKTLGHYWRVQPEVLLDHKVPETFEEFEFDRDHGVAADLNKSQTSIDFVHKQSDHSRFNKHTSAVENNYLYPPARLLENIPLKETSHGTTEMKNCYTIPTTPSRLITGKDQFKHPAASITNCDGVSEPTWHKGLAPIDTTHDGYEKYLDPYLTTSRLHHRPFTSRQLRNISSSKEVITYYTSTDVPWTRTPKPHPGDWWLPRNRPKSMYDREKFKQDLREIRVHNKLSWVPGSFRTEIRDNYICSQENFNTRNEDILYDIKSYYERHIANLPSDIPSENINILNSYNTEAKHIGSGKPICTAIEQYATNFATK